jgi:hypothetical protein
MIDKRPLTEAEQAQRERLAQRLANRKPLPSDQREDVSAPHLSEDD